MARAGNHRAGRVWPRRWAQAATVCAGAIALCGWTLTATAQSAVHKCVVDGRVTFQGTPCASGRPMPAPSVDVLNAQRRQRLAEAASAPTATPVPADVRGGSVPPAPSPVAPAPTTGTPPATRGPAAASFRCDGRTTCSQMRSCDEARYFLAHCPGVQMDGDRNGVPCERQWCAAGADNERSRGRTRRP